jgi:putative DNA primase/helicase
MVNVMRAVMGDYAVEADFSTFVEQPPEKPRPDLARLAGARLVYAEENKEGARLSEAVVKNLTGGGKVVARFLYGREFEYTPTFKLWLATNHRPVITATDYGMWRRIHLVPFDAQFEGDSADLGLEDRLTATELRGILSWAVAGCLVWNEEGLAPPLCVRAATAEYREASDLVGQFLAECCAEGGEADAGPLYRAYVEWAEANGERRLSSTMFGRRLTDRGIESGRRSAGKGEVRTRSGVHLLPVGVAASETWQRHAAGGR